MKYLRDLFRLFLTPLAGAEADPAAPPAAAAPEGGESGEGGEQGSSVDLSPVMDRMDEVLNRVGTLEQRLPQGEPEPPVPSPAEIPLGWETPGQQQPGQFGQPQVGELDPNDPQALVQAMQAEAARIAQEAQRPLIEKMEAQRRMDAADDFLDSYPEFDVTKNPETAEKAGQALAQDAQRWASDVSLGNAQLAQSLVREPAFLELVHLAAKTAERVGQETPAGQGQAQPPVPLEGAGTPNAGGEGSDRPMSERLEAAMGAKNPLFLGR